ncbi:uncharacterized protein LOC122068314 [Macadamia integrifolia]|uniref:uncharacterized protein LOC122068314 n=1 Tax=Macadamia integrifolia TaxID=60698 RepID=UPI001C4F309D|nr:uncharacterized protein LOC122068314 [Macadamia integrifolia]
MDGNPNQQHNQSQDHESQTNLALHINHQTPLLPPHTNSTIPSSSTHQSSVPASPLRTENTHHLPNDTPLEDDGDDAFSIEDDLDDILTHKWELSLVGKVLLCKPYRRQAIIEALPRAWNLTFPVAISLMQDDRYLFQFHHQLDYKNVLEEGPWAVGENLLILEKWRQEEDWSFNRIEFWIQIHDVPQELFHLDLATQMAAKVGNPQQVTLFGLRMRFIRCRVTIDIAKPLHISIPIKRKSPIRTLASVKYQRLPNFCYYCEMLDHEVKHYVGFSDAETSYSKEHGCAKASLCLNFPSFQVGQHI